MIYSKVLKSHVYVFSEKIFYLELYNQEYLAGDPNKINHIHLMC